MARHPIKHRLNDVQCFFTVNVVVEVCVDTISVVIVLPLWVIVVRVVVLVVMVSVTTKEQVIQLVGNVVVVLVVVVVVEHKLEGNVHDEVMELEEEDDGVTVVLVVVNMVVVQDLPRRLDDPMPWKPPFASAAFANARNITPISNNIFFIL